MNLLHLAWRESRAGRSRLVLSVAGIAVGVAALVAVQAFAGALRFEARDQSRVLMGADLAIESRQPLGEEAEALIAELRARGPDVARVAEMASMTRLSHGDRARLVRLRAAEPGYPFYGRPATDPAGGWDALGTGRSVLVDPGLLLALDAAPGDTLILGDAAFRIAGTVEPGASEVDIASAFAPRVYIDLEHLEATGLVQFGSLVQHAAYAALEPSAAAGVAREWRDRLRAEQATIGTAEQRGEALGASLSRLGSYLALVSVLALLLGGIGASSALRAHLAEREETIAVLRCLGATRRQVFGLYLGQALAVGLVGAVIGAVAGLLLQRGLPLALAELLPLDVAPRLDFRAGLIGVGTGLWVALAFSLPPLLEARGIPPLRALRRRLEPARRRDRSWTAAVLLLGLTAAAVATIQAGDLLLGLGFAAGAIGALALLHLAVIAVLRALRRVPDARLPFALRHGVANLQRPGNPARPAALAMAAGTLILVLLVSVEATLLRPLRFEHEQGRGNVLLWDVQDDQQPGVRQLLAERGYPTVQEAPMVPMRVSAVKGRPVGGATGTATRGPADGPMDGPTDDATGGGTGTTDGAGSGAGTGSRGGDASSGWATRREYRSTVRDSLVSSERLVAGRWWERGAAGEVSLEEGVAGELGVGVGDRVDWDVQGVTISTTVSSLREVDWTRFEPNFFAVFPPDALAGAPRTWILLARVDDHTERAAVQGEVIRRFPNVSVLDLTHIQSVVDRVFGRVSLAIRFLAGFTLAVGLVVMAAAAIASRRERVRESVLLRTIGATRAQLRAILLAESVTLGAIGAALGTVGGLLAAWALARWLFALPFALPALPTALTALAVAALAAGAGWAAARTAGRGTTLEALREE
jgi:putative ABC transport system permease protein